MVTLMPRIFSRCRRSFSIIVVSSRRKGSWISKFSVVIVISGFINSGGLFERAQITPWRGNWLCVSWPFLRGFCSPCRRRRRAYQPNSLDNTVREVLLACRTHADVARTQDLRSFGQATVSGPRSNAEYFHDEDHRLKRQDVRTHFFCS